MQSSLAQNRPLAARQPVNLRSTQSFGQIGRIRGVPQIACHYSEAAGPSGSACHPQQQQHQQQSALPPFVHLPAVQHVVPAVIAATLRRHVRKLGRWCRRHRLQEFVFGCGRGSGFECRQQQHNCFLLRSPSPQRGLPHHSLASTTAPQQPTLPSGGSSSGSSLDAPGAAGWRLHRPLHKPRLPGRLLGLVHCTDTQGAQQCWCLHQRPHQCCRACCSRAGVGRVVQASAQRHRALLAISLESAPHHTTGHHCCSLLPTAAAAATRSSPSASRRACGTSEPSSTQAACPHRTQHCVR